MTAQVSDGFQRQRRNLMVVSAILVLIYTSGLQFEQINLLGNSVVIENPAAIPFLLWVLWGYWLLRFFWFSKATSHSDLSEISSSLISKFQTDIAVNKAIKTLRSERSLLAPPQFRRKNFEIYSSLPHAFSGSVQLEWINSSPSGDELKSESVSVTLTRRDLLMARIKTYIQLSLTSRWFSEFYLPYVLGAMPLCVVAWLWAFGA